jgi:hypothetical protein
VNKKDNKPAALDHALYEMIMLLHSLPPAFDDSLASVVRSGWLEVFAIHARNLNEFFGKKNQRREYMKPADFVNGWNHAYSLDEELKKRADMQVAHLTYERETPEEKSSWPVERIFTNLRGPCLIFLQRVREQDALMTYKDNLARTVWLIETFPKVIFSPNVPSRSNIAPVQAGIRRSFSPNRSLDTTDL